MAAQPPRRTSPAPLNAHLMPLQRALRHRADEIEQKAADVRDAALGDHGRILTEIATEFRALADELHHW